MCETLNLYIRLYLRELRTPPMPNFLIGLDFIIWSTDTRLQVLWAKLPKIWGEISFMDIKKIKNVNYTSWVYICIIYLHILIYFMIFLYFREYRECPRCPPLAHRPIRMYILLYLIYTYAGQIKQHACTRTSGVDMRIYIRIWLITHSRGRACMHVRTPQVAGFCTCGTRTCVLTYAPSRPSMGGRRGIRTFVFNGADLHAWLPCVGMGGRACLSIRRTSTSPNNSDRFIIKSYIYIYEKRIKHWFRDLFDSTVVYSMEYAGEIYTNLACFVDKLKIDRNWACFASL